MTVEQYAEEQRQINLQAAALTYLVVRQYQRPDLAMVDWLALLELLYPVVERARTQSSVLARRFYDEQRAIHLPDAPEQDVELVGYDRREFWSRMEPERRGLSQEDATESALDRVVLRALKEVQGAGRKTIIRAAEAEPEPVSEQVKQPEPSREIRPAQVLQPAASAPRRERPKFSVVPPLAPEPELAPVVELDAEAEEPAAKKPKRKVQGWARMTTNPNPCSWCLMLVSRGPVYASAKTAGFSGKGKTAKALHEAGAEKEMRLAMRKWHPGCGCVVVPVFDKADWPGRERFLEAHKLWKETAKGQKDAVNAFRRAVDARNRRSQQADRITEVA